jgi:3-hydroxyisobutyrate dehydrogenase
MADNFLQGKFDPPEFALNLAFKDVTLATELAREIGVPMRLVSLAHAEMSEGMNRGWGGKDSRAFLMLQTERAKVEIKVPAADIQSVIEREG